MDTSFSRAARRGCSSAPRFEVLEGRDCPSCTIEYREGLLSILGDRGANDVAVLNTWAGTQVTCDGGETMTFTGVRAVSIRTMEGDDRVTFVSMSGERPAPMPALAVDLGSGDDTFAAVAEVAAGPCAVAVSGGAGRDNILVSLAFDQPSDPSAQASVRLDGGAGDDVMTVMTGGGQPGSLDVTMLGGEGNDRLTAATDFVPAVQGSAAPDSQFNLDMDGGAGDDMVSYLKQHATMHKSNAHLAGGNGNDTVAVRVEFNLTAVTDTRDHIDIDGGAGNDRLSFIDLPAPGTQTLLGYSYVVTMHGGSGNDVLNANVRYFGGASPNDTGSILEYGDGGDDKLKLLYEGPFTTLLMDGGAGTDTGLSPTRHTPNVTVQNCEL